MELKEENDILEINLNSNIEKIKIKECDKELFLFLIKKEEELKNIKDIIFDSNNKFLALVEKLIKIFIENVANSKH